MSTAPLYHRKSPDFRGNVLYPLNALRAVAVDLYERQRSKYMGREEILRQRVRNSRGPKVWCGTRRNGSRSIPSPQDTRLEGPIGDEEFEPFDIERLARMSELPASTREYYRSVAPGSSRYFIFVGVPHVLHRGPVDVAAARLVLA